MLPHTHTSTPLSSAPSLPGASAAPIRQLQPLPPDSFSPLSEVFADLAFVSDLHLAFLKRDRRLSSACHDLSATDGDGGLAAAAAAAARPVMRSCSSFWPKQT